VIGPKRIRVALFATHPIQYHVPWFQKLSARPELEFKVFFGFEPDAVQQGVGFGVGFHWDIPLRDGYASEMLTNVSKGPSLGVFAGCDTPRVGESLRTWAPDAAILTGWHSKMLIQAWWAAVRLRVPRILRGESNAIRRREAWKRAGHRFWLHGFHEFLAIGKANHEFYRQAGIPDQRIHDCPYFVDNKRFSASAQALHERRGELRREWAIPADATCFLFSGKLIAKKRPLDLFAALHLAHPVVPSMHLLVAGTGELMAQARAIATAQRLPVTFAGFLNQTEIARAYVAADCLVLPSDTGETWGLVVNEAMACGLPAVVSDQVGCGPDLVIDGLTGAKFPMGDVQALANRMIECARDRPGLLSMGTKARHHVLSSYSVERAVDGTLAAIDAITARR
jgi:glycosyltransferase involved in cell wall biosynthesis